MCLHNDNYAKHYVDIIKLISATCGGRNAELRWLVKTALNSAVYFTHTNDSSVLVTKKRSFFFVGKNFLRFGVGSSSLALVNFLPSDFRSLRVIKNVSKTSYTVSTKCVQAAEKE